MECNLKNRSELIADYLLGNLSEDKAKAFEEHYFQCEICFNELKAAEDAIKLIKQEGPEILETSSGIDSKSKSSENSKNFLSKLFFPGLSSKGWGIAVGTAVVIAVILFLVFQNNESESNNNVIAKKKEIIQEKSNESQVSKENPKDNCRLIRTHIQACALPR